MMKLLIFSFFLNLSLVANGQPPPVGSTRNHPELDKYLGTWLYQEGTSSIEIKLKKVYYNDGEVTEDILLGVHKYVRNGIVIEDNLSLYNSLAQNQKGSLYIWVDWHHPNPDSLMGKVRDVPKRKYLYIYINHLGGTPAQMKCNIQTGHGINIDPTRWGQTWPEGDLIFTKQ